MVFPREFNFTYRRGEKAKTQEERHGEDDTCPENPRLHLHKWQNHKSDLDGFVFIPVVILVPRESVSIIHGVKLPENFSVFPSGSPSLLPVRNESITPKKCQLKSQISNMLMINLRLPTRSCPPVILSKHYLFLINVFYVERSLEHSSRRPFALRQWELRI